MTNKNKNKLYKKYTKMLHDIEQTVSKYNCMTDDELKQQTEIIKFKVKSTNNINKIIPEAFSVAIEAIRRVLGLEVYRTQIIGGVILFWGDIAEMKTGEGKTLVSIMPMYLRALMGQGNFIITPNEYLAWRDSTEVGKVFTWLGLRVGVGVQKNEYSEEIDKSIVYSSDIIYTTHSALGFDYLLDNLASSKKQMYLPPLNYVIIDEIDSVLLDMAQTPLIISGAPKLQSNLFELVDEFTKSLLIDIHYELDEDKKSIWITSDGMKIAEKYFCVTNILGHENKELFRHIMLSLRANYVMHCNRDYIISKEKIFLLDEINGRKLIGTKLQGGLHQALEAKENLEISEETKSMGTVTYQNLFKMFKKISGMTGTAYTDKEEFLEFFNLNVICVPTNKNNIRRDHVEEMFFSNKQKMLESIQCIRDSMRNSRPTLVVTGSVSKSYLYSLILLDNGIPHSLLNASTINHESKIIESAGKPGSVTLSTAVSGRGTDIKLDKSSKENGGLVVVGTERMSNARVDNQLRGRAGRQGEPGDTYFYTSLEDPILIENSPRWVLNFRKKYLNKTLKKKEYFNNHKFKTIMDKAQIIKKNKDMANRRQTLEFDDIISVIRNNVYNLRNKILESNCNYLKQVILDSCLESIYCFCLKKDSKSSHSLNDYIINNINYSFNPNDQLFMHIKNNHGRIEILYDLVTKQLDTKFLFFVSEYQKEYYLKMCILKALDKSWIDLLDALEQFKIVVRNRSWGQHQPLFEYQKEANRFFAESLIVFQQDVMRYSLLSELMEEDDGSINVEFP